MYWLDSCIRVFYVEFVVYNFSINMVVVVMIMFEFLFLGGVYKSFEVFIVSMYGFLWKYLVVRIIGEVIVVVVFVFMIYCVVFMIFYDKC